MKTVGVVFGGVSVEHEVSVISALQAAAAMDKTKYKPVPIYIGKDGYWYSGDFLLNVESFRDMKGLLKKATRVQIRRLVNGKVGLEAVSGFGWRRKYSEPIDVVLIGLHGGEGENGSLQGMFETLNVPYTGSGVMASAVGMDKITAKRICQSAGIPVVDYAALHEKDWANQEENVLDECEKSFAYPMIVKPSRLGSSIGIQKADNRQALDAAIEDAFRYDERILIEKAVSPLREINCSVLGDGTQAVVSVLEEPVMSGDAGLLSFQDKYQRGADASSKSGHGSKQTSRSEGMASLDRIIPAQIDESRAQKIREMAVEIFQLFDAAGVSRIDFILDESDDSIYFNEINTIPGSFSFYLWEPLNIRFDQLVDRLLELAIAAHRRKNSRVRSYDTNLLSERSAGGLKSKV